MRVNCGEGFLCYTARQSEPRMNPERWQKLKELCRLALAREPQERVAFLAEACRDDEELRREAESLIARATHDERTLDEPIWEGRSIESAATVIDHYHLLQKIGEGGMGEVWLAEQKEPVRRRVALKLVKAGMNTREVIGRFESERQALALMEHPAIAKVFDAGSTPNGAPYFAMEYVAGVPITEYCDNHRLSIKERLELFMQVCEGVRHAHQKAVIHRDLKPSNILVTEVDGRAAPKIIDFGVAKALSQKLTAHTMFTRVGTLIGTPEYMSPEQALSSGEDVDTRTDVYSLGIIFYELLAGAPPIELRKIAFDEFLRRLREEDPPKPSTKIRTGDAATTTELARKRQTEPVALMKQIGGDLDSIALKALEKDRGRRYGSVSDFAGDIGRYLRNEAVHAVPPSAVYRARKFASRHRWGLAMACAFVVVLAAAAAISIRQSIRANREAAVAEAVSNFLQNDLLAQASARTQATPSTKPDPDLKVRTALDRAAGRIEGKFAGQPEVEASIRDTMGQTYMALGLYPEARKQLEQALELHERAGGAKSPKALKTMSNLGAITVLEGKFPEAEALLSQVYGIQRSVLGAEHPDTLVSAHRLGTVYSEGGKYAPAEALERQTLDIQRRVLGPEDPDTLRSMCSLALVYDEEGNYAQAEALASQTLEIQRRKLGPEHPDTLMTAGNLAMVYDEEGKYAQAEALDRETLEIRRRVEGPEHYDTLITAGNLAIVYFEDGKYAQAEALDSETLEIRRRVEGPEHPDTLMTACNLGMVYTEEGKYAKAEAVESKTLEIQRRMIGSEHRDTLATAANLAAAYNEEGKYAQADALQSQFLEISRRALGPEHPVTLSYISYFAFFYQKRGNFPLAETYAAQALEGRRHALGADHPDTMASAADLAFAYVSERKFAAAEPLAREAFEFNRKAHPEEWERFHTESLLGASLAGQRRYTEGEALLLEGYQGMLARKDQIGIPERLYLDCGHQWVIDMYKAWGKAKEAADWAKK
jgi:eukaryotic-like serine/threonine-protein kinase